MTRRSDWHHRLELLGGATVRMAVPRGSVHFLFALDGIAVVAGPDATEAIAPLEGLLIDRPSSAPSLRVAAADAKLVSIRLTPA